MIREQHLLLESFLLAIVFVQIIVLIFQLQLQPQSQSQIHLIFTVIIAVTVKMIQRFLQAIARFAAIIIVFHWHSKFLVHVLIVIPLTVVRVLITHLTILDH